MLVSLVKKIGLKFVYEFLKIWDVDFLVSWATPDNIKHNTRKEKTN